MGEGLGRGEEGRGGPTEPPVPSCSLPLSSSPATLPTGPASQEQGHLSLCSTGRLGQWEGPPPSTLRAPGTQCRGFFGESPRNQNHLPSPSKRPAAPPACPSALGRRLGQEYEAAWFA